MTTTFNSVEHAIRWSEEHNSPATLVVKDINTTIADAEALGYLVDYCELNRDLNDDRDTYDIWGQLPNSENMSWRLTAKVELQD